MDLAKCIQGVLDGDAVLFLGAGFSLGAENVRGKQFMTGAAIASHFATLAGLPQGARLEDAAEAYAEVFGLDALMREVQEEFTANGVCSHHRQVAALPWKRVYTTNYDNVFEIASGQEGQRVTPVTLGSDIYKMPKDHRICVHLNGYVDSLDRGKILSELKLTDESYVTATIIDTQWAMLLRQDIRLASAVFFIGYSMYDVDIKKILAEAENTKEKVFFYVGPNPDWATQRKVSRYGSMLTASTEDFIKEAQDIAASYVPKDCNELRPLSVRECKPPFPPKPINDQAFRDLLLWGKHDDNLVSESLRTDTTYYLQRSNITNALNMIDDGNRILVISSDLGNGKTMFLEGLRHRAVERGFRVFDLFDHNDGVDKELEAIARSGEKVLVTAEEYQNWLDQIRLFCVNAGDHASLILTARNAVHDVLVDDLSAIVGNKSISELNIDSLTDEEIEWLVDALDQYGLWGGSAGLGRPQKVRFIAVTCRRQLHALLLRLLSSPDIGRRVSFVAEHLRARGDNYEPLLSIFILTLLNHAPSLDILADIWGPDKIYRAQFRSDPVAKELVDFKSGAILVRSPIAAEFILRSFSDAGTLVSVLTRMAQCMERGRSVSPRYWDIFKNLMRFSSLQGLLPEQGRRNAVIQYYESLKNLGACTRNPLFWLQYAIASLVIEDLPRAKTYFDTAYSLAAGTGFDTFQIDNHFSRFLMVQAVKELDFRSAMANYRQALTIIERQAMYERRHYPYRVAIYFQDFLNRFGLEMDDVEIEEFARGAERILGRIAVRSNYQGDEHRHVLNCKKAMNYVISVCEELVNNRKNAKEGTELANPVDNE